MAKQKRPSNFRNINTDNTRKCNTAVGLFTTLNSKFKPQYNETISHFNSES